MFLSENQLSKCQCAQVSFVADSQLYCLCTHSLHHPWMDVLRPRWDDDLVGVVMLWNRGTTLLIGGIASVSFGSTYTQNDLPGKKCVDSRLSLCRMRQRVSDIRGSCLWRFWREWPRRAGLSSWVTRFMLDVSWLVYQGGRLHADSVRTGGLLSWGTLGCWGFCGLYDGFCEVVESDAVGEK